MRLRPTVRGGALAAAGAVALHAGVSLGALDLARVGVLLLVLVLVALAVVALGDPARGRRLEVVRDVTPNPVHAGEEAQVHVVVRANDAGARARLAGLRFAEQAAVELSGGRPLRARVRRAADRVTVTYPVHGTQRGRWPLGPLVVTRTDVFGVVRARTTLGEDSEVAVWPAVTPLPAPGDVLVGEPDRVALGARTPSPDDASLRDYREGDDLRRVHWRSSARRGALLVRSDERAGMRPVTVLLDLPVRSSAAEWTISVAASMALAMLDGGHPVRLVGAGIGTGTAGGTAGTSAFVHGRSGPEARAALLDLTVDLQPARSTNEAEAHLLDAARLLHTTGSGGEIVLAVLGPLTAAARAALAHVSDAGQGWALVRADGRHGGDERDARHTQAALVRAGWRAAPATAGEDPVACWLRLLGSAR
ncbi:DUF58 domain-containing protein [Cellulomonas telluris]|uniref:DUF58 domain-containing protein n=1 Tax=Cellulomonas telluris TaxID=2306636 RepID=UPI0010A7A97B|nr:DUF58 domain-containing protein [Cellulomonas telluris]